MKPERAREIATDFSRLATGTLSPQNLRLNSDGSFYDPDMLRLFEQAIILACAEQREMDAMICDTTAEFHGFYGTAAKDAAVKIRGQT